MTFDFSEKISILGKILWMLFLWMCVSSTTFAEKLPFKTFTTADGLVNNHVNRIYQDKKGFLWFATGEGLSRFDGYEFTNYGVRDGLPNQIINDVLEDRQGRFWVAANDYGIARLVDKSDADNSNAERKRKFIKFLVNEEVHGANKVDRLLIDSKDNLWCLTDEGIYRGVVSDNPVFTLIKAYNHPVIADASRALFEDQQRNVWFGIHNELFEARSTGGEIINHGFIDGDENNFIINAIQTADGRIIVLSREKGLYEFIPAISKWQKLHGELKKINYFYSLIEDKDNSLWFGGGGGLAKLAHGKLTEYSNEQGFEGDKVLSLFQDREGILWSGNRSSGIIKLSNMAITKYPLAVGESSLGIAEEKGILKSFFCEINKETSWMCRARMKPLTDLQSENSEQFEGILFDFRSFSFAKRGDVWVLNNSIGLFPVVKDSFFHFPDGEKIDLKQFFEKPFKTSDDLTVYLDEKGFLWISRADGLIYRVKPAKTGNPEIEKFQWEFKINASLMISDRKGGLWLFRRGRNGGRLRNGQYQSFDSLKTIPTQALSVFLDSRGWMWIGTYFDGLFVCKNPAEDQPVFDSYTTENGLLSDSIWDIAEDNDGRMYFGTGKGMSRFDLQGGIWHSFTTKDGLTGDKVTRLFKDLEGNIWINTAAGLAKFNPKIEIKSTEPPPVYITNIKIAGKDYPISETGIIETAPVSLDYSQNNLTINFVGLQFKSTDYLTYQYKLEGTDNDWSSPSKNRSIYFANLASGDYRFLVRAINEDGLIGTQIASFQFKILPPIFLRWWFIALLASLIVLLIYSYFRMRLQRLLDVERTRTLIATDLHDDIGSNLSKISILSEVVRMQLEHAGKSDSKLLNSIAEISRNSVSSMSDIVWAINPKRDSALEMVRKMREYAEDIFVPKDILVTFSAPAKSEKIKLSMDLRRDLYLIFKEAVNNISKHSNCTEVKMNFDVHRQEVILQIEDNGIGFKPAICSNGNGLINMKNRTKRLKGSFQIESEPNCGTKITIQIPQH